MRDYILLKTKIISILAIAVLLFSSIGLLSIANAKPPTPAPTLLDATTIPKYVNQLTGPPPVYVPRVIRGQHGEIIRHEYTIQMRASNQQILPTQDENGDPTGYPTTPVWGYGGIAKDAVTGKPLGFVLNSPGPTFEATRGIPVYVNWQNRISEQHMFAVDPTLHWADPNNMGMPTDLTVTYPPGYPEAQWPVPLIPHLHGGEVQSTYDGNPDSWFTFNGIQGPEYNTARNAKGGNSALFIYPNSQEPATLWYHDHALGITRINVMSGLAGFYLLSDPSDTEVEPLLPSGEYDMPLVFQDRNFLSDGSFYFPVDEATNPDVHPYWSPEFFGEVSMVDGLVWPNMDVKQGIYRFRLLDGSNARFYNLHFSNNMEFTQIATDGGFLKESVPMTSLLIAPGERAEILVDFSEIAADTEIRLLNDANGPYPDGDPVDPDTMGQLMQFTVIDEEGYELPEALPTELNPTLAGDFPNLPDPDNTRVLTLTEVQGPGGPLEVLLDGQKWAAPISEVPVLGTTEDWVIFNPTADTHPIHLHLVQFQLVSRQTFDPTYFDIWRTLNGRDPTMDLDSALENPTVNVADYTTYLTNSPMLPSANDQGWKDTIQMNPGEVTTIRVRFTAQDGSDFPFDATEGPGYVWHCHIIDHEDNEMMRPYRVVAP